MEPENQVRNTQLDGTIQLPNGRQVPITVTVDWNVLDKASASAPDSLLLRAVEVFGKTDKAWSWLTTANPMLSNKTPQAAAQTEEGTAEVLGVLFDIEHGFPA